MERGPSYDKEKNGGKTGRPENGPRFLGNHVEVVQENNLGKVVGCGEGDGPYCTVDDETRIVYEARHSAARRRSDVHDVSKCRDGHNDCEERRKLRG